MRKNLRALKMHGAGALLLLALYGLGAQHAAFAKETAEPAKALTANDIIAGAEKYTVKIRTLSEIGLNRDSGGSGSGTGFLVDKDRGWIMTNAHVAKRSPATITVAFKNGQFNKVKRIFVDTEFDIAILEIDKKLIPADALQAELDCTALPEKGTPVAIYGHPGNLFFTATRGIVSSTPWLWWGEKVQSDATINGGNSGGPLINLENGKIIGVASSSMKTNGGEHATAVSLSEPMVHVCPILSLLRDNKNPQVRQLPVAYATGDDDYRPVIAEVFDPALKLEQSDIIKGVNGKMEVRNTSDLSTRLRGQEGDVILNIERDGKMINIAARAAQVGEVLDIKALDMAGLIITKDWAADARWSKEPDYLVIDYIRQNSPAVMTDSQPGQQIISVDKKKFNSLDALEAYLKTRKAEDKINLIVRTPLYNTIKKWIYYSVVLERGEIKRLTARDDMSKG